MVMTRVSPPAILDAPRLEFPLTETTVVFVEFGTGRRPEIGRVGVGVAPRKEVAEKTLFPAAVNLFASVVVLLIVMVALGWVQK